MAEDWEKVDARSPPARDYSPVLKKDEGSHLNVQLHVAFKGNER